MTGQRGRAVVMATLMAAAVAGLAFEGGEKAGVAIDLTGAWTVSVEGDVSLTCTVDVQQAGTDLGAQLSCPGVRETPLVGDVDPQTRRLFLDLKGESGLDVELDGTVSQDGDKVEGTWEWSGGDLTGTFHAVRGVGPPSVTNLSGEWSVETDSDPSDSCSAHIEQDGNAVDVDLQCAGQPGAMLTGDIENGILTLTGDPYYKVTAAVSPDGIAFGGTWFVSSPTQWGPFTGLKIAERTFDGDVTGDWRITITGGLLGTCDVAAQQVGGEVFAAFDCGPAGGWWLRGAIDEAASRFSLTGDAGSLRDYTAQIRGVLSEDGRSFTATFVASHEEGSSWGGGAGTLSGEQMDSSPSLPNITAGYSANLTSTLGERVPCEVLVEQVQEVLTSEIDCPGVGLGELEGWISPLTGAFAMEGTVGDVELAFEGTVRDEGGFLLAGDWTTNRRFVSGCFTTEGKCGKENLQAPGDANCDMRTNSVDASLVLQVSAGLLSIESIPCSSNVFDLRHECCPVVLNALDAAIILQLDAGLFGRLAG